MASDQSFVDYVCEQLAAAGHISHRKMFGEYAVYCDGKVVVLVCDNQCFLKDTEAGRALLPRASEGLPYPGAKPWLLMDEWLEDDHLVAQVVRKTAACLPVPAPKAPRKRAASKVNKSRSSKR